MRPDVRPPGFLPVLCLALTIAAPLDARELDTLESASLRGAWLVRSDSPRTAVTLAVLAGERDNTGVAGLAHYAEHLVWLSAVDADAGEADRHSNASTDRVMTRYRLDGPGEALGDMLVALARVFEPIALPETFMNEEIGIVQREYDLRVRESPGRSLSLELARLQHGGRWPGRSVIGTPASIARLTPAAAVDWQARTHRPGNAVLLVHGDHEPDAVNALVAATFGASAAGTGSARSVPIGPSDYRMASPVTKVIERVEPRLSGPEILHSRLTRLERSAEPLELTARLDLLWSVLDSTRAGGLAGPLRYDDFVARGFDLDLSAIDGRHVELGFTAWPDRGVDNRTLLDRFESTLLDSAREGIPIETFERVRARLLDDVDEAEAPDEIVLGTAFDLLALGAAPVPLSAYRARLAAVTLADLNALLGALADAPRTVTLLVEPGGNG